MRLSSASFAAFALICGWKRPLSWARMATSRLTSKHAVKNGTLYYRIVDTHEFCTRYMRSGINYLQSGIAVMSSSILQETCGDWLGASSSRDSKSPEYGALALLTPSSHVGISTRRSHAAHPGLGRCNVTSRRVS